MKELSIEEKAKRYDEALKVLHKYDGAHIMFTQDLKEEMFPELAESEDEKIRKELIKFVKVNIPDEERYIAWLEKQGEHANFLSKIQVGDKVTRNKDGVLVNLSQLNRVAKKQGEQKPGKEEPEFKVGDWVVSPNGVYWHIDAINNNRYEVSSTDGACADWPLDTDLYHLWTIQDAKDGDVLACNEEILLFKSYSVQGRISLYCWYNGRTNNFHSKGVADTLLTTRNKIYPATKEQRDTLEKTMADAGYTFDFEKKELKKIEQKQDVNIQINPSEYINDMGGNGCYLKNTTQNHAWSEEDEDYYNAIITKLEVTQDDALLTDNQIEFLKSLKERVQPKREWNEENKKMLECAIDMIEWYSVVNKSKSKLVSDWLKSFRPQLQWKPSDKQMEGLECTIKTLKYQLNAGDNRLNSLYNDLKKLREE